MKRNRLFFVFPAFALLVGSMPATASAIFSDLGPSGNVYDSDPNGWSLSGSTNSIISESFSRAQLFTATGSGTLAVTQIDLAVSNVPDQVDTFYASIWTDDAGLPGTEVADAYWSLSTSTSLGSCCDLVSVTGITGVDVTGGQEYFLILGPLSPSDASYNAWNLNNQSVDTLNLNSYDGASTWNSDGSQPAGAFDILGSSVPEPGSVLLLGTGLIGLLGAYRRAAKRRAPHKS